MLLADPQEPTETASSEQDYLGTARRGQRRHTAVSRCRLRRECVVLTASNGAEASKSQHNQAVDTPWSRTS